MVSQQPCSGRSTCMAHARLAKVLSATSASRLSPLLRSRSMAMVQLYGRGATSRFHAAVRTLTTPLAAGQIFNIGNPDATIDTNGLAELIASIVPAARLQLRDVNRAEVAYRTPIIEKARRILAFEPRIGLREGLHRTISGPDCRWPRRLVGNVSVIGVGKMGLPIAICIASNGAKVWACDKNPAVVEAIQVGRPDVGEPGVSDLLAQALETGQLTATTDTTKAVAASDVVIVILPPS